MTAAALRALTNGPPVLPCSPVVILDQDGRHWQVRRVETQTPRDDVGQPTGVPVAVLVIEPMDPTPGAK